MKFWTMKEVRLLLEWAKTPAEERTPFESMASTMCRTPAAIKECLRRWLPPGQRPWKEKPRWSHAEIEAVSDGLRIVDRTQAALKKFHQRQRQKVQREGGRTVLTVKQVAEDLGISRTKAHRLLGQRYLRRFDGGIAESSFRQLLREHPEVVPYKRLPRQHQEWLVINGYPDNTIIVKSPSSRGLLES